VIGSWRVQHAPARSLHAAEVADGGEETLHLGTRAVYEPCYGRGAVFARASMASCEERTGDVTRAVEHLRVALTLPSSCRLHAPHRTFWSACEDAALGDGATFAYERLAELLLQTGQSEEAFVTVQRKNASRLYPLLSKLSPEVSDRSLRHVP